MNNNTEPRTTHGYWIRTAGTDPQDPNQKTRERMYFIKTNEEQGEGTVIDPCDASVHPLFGRQPLEVVSRADLNVGLEVRYQAEQGVFRYGMVVDVTMLPTSVKIHDTHVQGAEGKVVACAPRDVFYMQRSTEEEEEEEEPEILNSMVPCCDVCGRVSRNNARCSRCKKKWYCGQACQKSAWKEHKKNCFPGNSSPDAEEEEEEEEEYLDENLRERMRIVNNMKQVHARLRNYHRQLGPQLQPAHAEEFAYLDDLLDRLIEGLGDINNSDASVAYINSVAATTVELLGQTKFRSSNQHPAEAASSSGAVTEPGARPKSQW